METTSSYAYAVVRYDVVSPLQDQRFDELMNPTPTNSKRTQSTTRQKPRTNPKPSTARLPDYFNSDPSDNEEFHGFRAADVMEEIPDFGRAELEIRTRMEVLFVESESEQEFTGFTQQEMLV